jgi:dihydroorotase
MVADQLQKPLLDQVPNLKVVMEHITTADAASFVASAPANIAATITPQHMLLNRNALFAVSGSVWCQSTLHR